MGKQKLENKTESEHKLQATSITSVLQLESISIEVLKAETGEYFIKIILAEVQKWDRR